MISPYEQTAVRGGNCLLPASKLQRVFHFHLVFGCFTYFIQDIINEWMNNVCYMKGIFTSQGLHSQTQLQNFVVNRVSISPNKKAQAQGKRHTVSHPFREAKHAASLVETVSTATTCNLHCHGSTQSLVLHFSRHQNTYEKIPS